MRRPLFILCETALSIAGIATVSPAAMIVVADYDFAGGSAASIDVDALTEASDYDTRTSAMGGSPTISNISSASENAFMRATTTPSSSSPAGDTNIYYHEFMLDVTGLAPGKRLNLNYDYGPNTNGNFGGSNFFTALYSPTTGLVDTSDKIGGPSLFQAGNDVGASAFIDLTSGNPAAGADYTGLSNGSSIDFRIYFGDNSSAQSRIHRVDNVQLIAQVVPEPSGLGLAIFGLMGLSAVGVRRN